MDCFLIESVRDEFLRLHDVRNEDFETWLVSNS